MKDSFGRTLIDMCIDKNVLVSDTSHKDIGVVTKRLIYFMKQNAPGINTIIFSPDVYFEFVSLDWDFRAPLRAFDIELIKDDRLSVKPDGHWLEYYKLRGGFLNHRECLAIGFKSNCPIIEFKEQDYVLGAY